MPLLKWLKWPKVAAGEWLLCRGSAERKSKREREREGEGAYPGGFNLEGPVGHAAQRLKRFSCNSHSNLNCVL